MTEHAEPPRAARPAVVDVARWWALDYLYAAQRQLAALAARQPPAEWSSGDPALPTVVLLPGVYEHWSFLRPLARALNAHGHRIRVVHGLGANLLGIPETAERVAHALGRVSVPDAGQVLVGHSKGGLVGKELLLRDDVTELGLRGLVAVATPFGGSSLSRYVLDPVLREFDPGGQVITALAGKAGVNGRIVSVFGPFDPHVPEGSALAGALNVRVPAPGHFRVLKAQETIAAVAAGVDGLGRMPLG